MPSGSGSSGCGGSHFSHSSTSHGYSGSRVVRPIIIGNCYLNTKDSQKVNDQRVGGVFLIMFGLFMFLIMFFISLDLNKIKEDRDRYINMIQNANNDSRYIREGTITGIGYNDNGDKYYYTYMIDTDNNSGSLSGYTYSIYTKEQIDTFVIGSKTYFAVEDLYITQESDSVNMDYIYFDLEDDGEYANNITGMKILPIIGIIMLLCSIPCFVSANKLIKANKKPIRDHENIDDPTHTYCKYCGFEVEPNAKTCKYCGVDLTEK